MLISFSIQNFGSIKDKQTLSFEADDSTHLEDYYVIKAGGMRLLKLALIYGANASGKTTILKALDFLRKLALEPKSQKNETLDFQPFLFDDQTPHQSSILAIDFLQNDVRYFYEVEFTQQAVLREELYSYKTKKANVFKRTTDVDKQLSAITFGSKIKINKTAEQILEANTLWNNTVLGGFLKTNFEFTELEEINNWFTRNLVLNKEPSLAQIFPKVSPRNQNRIISILQRADFNISHVHFRSEEEIENNIRTQLDNVRPLTPDEPFNITSIKLLGKTILEHTIQGKKYLLPMKLESEGTKKYSQLTPLLLGLIKTRFVMLFDELESSLHPDLYIHFLLTFLVNAKSSQLIATTHNREILNNRDLFRNDAIWFTQKNESGATELYSLADFDTSVVRNTTNVYNAYKVGKLGGVPHLGDYYIDFDQED
jgi:AAA15 family ATPase/GTPase